MGETFACKVLAKKSGKNRTVAGEIVVVRPDHLLMHDNTAAIVDKIGKELDEFGVTDTDLPVIVLDHVIPAATEKTAVNHKKAREFARRFEIGNFFDAGAGICHQVMLEKGLALPGNLIVGSDSHTCSYGAVGAFSTGVDRTEAAALILRGRMWLKVPETIKIVFEGRLSPPVSAKDLILTIIGDIGADGAGYKAVEFHGNVGSLTMEDRITISNMGVEMGAKIAVFPVDTVTREFFDSIGVDRDALEILWADEDAEYCREIHYDLSVIEPVVALPHNVDNVKPVSEVEGLRVDQFLLGTCTNGRIGDLEIAASYLDGKTIAPGSRLLVLPSSKAVFDEALARGTIACLSAAGAIILPPGCGPCLGAHQGVLAPGERCLSSANRNFKGRMGCRDAEIYLASPAVVAASAITGSITNPGRQV